MRSSRESCCVHEARRRCDRILWKSTIKLNPETIQPDLPEGRTRNRVGTLLSQAFRPITRRRDSSSPLNLEDNQVLPSGPRLSVPLVKAATEYAHDSPDLVSFDLLKSPHVLRHSRSIDTVPTKRMSITDSPRTSPRGLDYPANRRSSTDTQTSPRSLDYSANRRSSMDTQRPASPDLDSPETDSFPTLPATKSDIPPAVLPKDNTPTPPASTRWGRLFAFRRDTSVSVATLSENRHTSSGPALPVRGDVVCLDYRSLDDREMRLLEGRSDHRPVIGSYAAYI